MSLFNLHEKLNILIYRMFNIFSDIVFFFNLPARRKIKENKHFSGLHKGQRCFIAATGPSLGNLSTEQKEFLQDEVVFAVNSFYKAESMDAINPDYYVLMDNNYWGTFGHTFEDICRKYPAAPPVFITDVRATQLIPDGVSSIPLYAKNYPISSMRVRLDGNCSITMNVVGFAILSAMYMGFSEIYLLGSDYNLFCSRKGNHCYDDKDEFSRTPSYNLAFYLKYYHLTTEFHYRLAEYGRKNGHEIVNLTPASLLDAYPLDNPDDFFRKNMKRGTHDVH